MHFRFSTCSSPPKNGPKWGQESAEWQHGHRQLARELRTAQERGGLGARQVLSAWSSNPLKLIKSHSKSDIIPLEHA